MKQDKTVYLTEQGFQKLKSELAYLQNVKRPALMTQFLALQGGGDWMDDTEDMNVREELAFIDGRIRELEIMLATGKLIEADQEGSTIQLGSTVVIQQNDEPVEKYTIVGAAEADPAAGLISNESPLGQALLGRKVGDDVEVQAPAGTLRFHIISIA